jgi:uncharacterized protein YndB with AHSA1/START domain
LPFTKSSGKLEPGTNVRWEWEMYDVSATVRVKELEENSRILIEWDPDSPEVIECEWRFYSGEGDTTFVRITETGYEGSRDEIVARVIDSTSGFAFVLCALKALLEHDVELTIVADSHPEGFDS